MDVKEAIVKRRSIRKYQDKEVPDETIRELMYAARLAPSGNNAQPWKYKIFKTEEEKKMLKENSIFKQDFVYTAPIIILCCGNTKAYPEKKSDRLDDSNHARTIRDLALSTQNIVLRATELGLGTCYVGWMDKPKIKKLLELPEEYIVPYVITIGYPDEQPKTRKTIEEILL